MTVADFYSPEKDLTLFGKAKNVFGAFGFLVIWTTFIIFALTSILFHQVTYSAISHEIHVGIPILQWFGPVAQFGWWEETWFGSFFFACIFAPLWEEAVFRHFALTLVKGSSNFKKNIVPIVILTSCIFGYLHGSIINMLIQGVAGLVLSAVYIRNGFSYWSSVSLHALWNFFLMYLLQFLAQ